MANQTRLQDERGWERGRRTLRRAGVGSDKADLTDGGLGGAGTTAELRTKQPARFLWLQLRLWLLLQHSSTKLQYFAVVELNLGNERRLWVLRMLQH